MRLPRDIGPIHFVGIGGIGMSGIAEVLANLNYTVTGSDVSESANVKRLRDKNIKVAIGHDARNVEGAGVVVVSTAIKRDNPEMTDAQIAYSIAQMKAHHVVDGGDARTLGVGAMTDARMASFFEKMAKAGVVPADLDYKRGYTLRFVNRKVGLEP